MVGVRDDLLPIAIDQQICGFERGLADEHFAAEDEECLRHDPVEDFHVHGFGQFHALCLAVGHLRIDVPHGLEAKPFLQVHRNARAHGTGVDDGIDGDAPDLLPGDEAPSDHPGINAVAQVHTHSDLAHARTVP